MRYFYWKIAEIAQRWGLHPRSPFLWRLEALPPDSWAAEAGARGPWPPPEFSYMVQKYE